MIADASVLGGIFGLILILIGLVLSIWWLVFPFIVAHYLASIEKLLRQLTDRQNETNRALQFLVDKK